MTTYAEKLLDKARQSCHPSNYSGLAARLGVTRQWVSRWKNGYDPIPYNDFRILAQMAKVNEEEWWLLLQHDQADAAIKPKLKTLIERLGIAACTVLLMAPLAHTDNAAQVPFSGRENGHFAYYVTSMLRRSMGYARDSLLRLYRFCHGSNLSPCLLA